MLLISNQQCKIQYIGKTIVHEFDITYKKKKLLGQIVEINNRIQTPILKDKETGEDVTLSFQEKEEIYTLMFGLNNNFIKER